MEADCGRPAIPKVASTRDSSPPGKGRACAVLKLGKQKRFACQGVDGGVLQPDAHPVDEEERNAQDVAALRRLSPPCPL